MRYIEGIRSTIACVIIATLVGCNGNSLQTNEVSGTVLLEGTPLELIHVEFWPVGDGPRSIGKTDGTGKFILELDDRSKKGAAVGTHKVMLRDTWPMKDNVLSQSGEWIDNSKGKKARISSKYYDVSTSPLEYEVKTGPSNHFEIQVQPRK